MKNYYTKWTEHSEKYAKEMGISFDDGRESYETANSMRYYEYFVVNDNIASGTNIPKSFMGDEVILTKNGIIECVPCLTALDVNIGEMFFYKGSVWTRIGRYSAYSYNFGTCHFGNLGEGEFEDFTDKAVKLSTESINNLLVTNLDKIKE